MKKFFILLFTLTANAGMLLADSDVIFSESFSTSKGNFTISNKQMPSNISYVWQWKSANYGMVASAFASGTAYASESWLISPTISLEDCSSATLSFAHALNKGASTNLRVKVSVDSGSTWSDLSISQWPAGTNWTFINATASLDDYVGNTIQIAFCYISTTSLCPQWEVKNFKILGIVNDNGSADTSWSRVKIGNLYYNLDTDSKTAEVTYENASAGFPSYDETLTSVAIPSSVINNNETYRVTSIGDFAFWSCRGLTSVTIPNSVTTIGNYAFSWCTNLTSATIPNSVTSVGKWAFYSCKALASIALQNNITSIGDSAFTWCTNLTTVTIPNSVTHIENGTFANCSSLTSLTIGNSVTSIGEATFSNCRGLTFVEIPNSVISIGAGAFFECTGLTSVIIGDKVTSIGDYAFNECSSVTSLTIGNSVTSIGEAAFSYCRSLTFIEIPNSVTSIGNGAFGECRNITSVAWNAVNCNSYNFGSQVNSFIFGENVEVIPASLCSGMNQLRDITIPNSVMSIGDYAFKECTGLTSVIIPNSVTSIGDYAFNGCTGLTSVTIPNSVTSIGDYAFRGRSYLEIHYNGSLYEWLTKNWSTTKIAPYLGDTYALYIGDDLVDDLIIPNSVTRIENRAFSGCTSLISVTIPHSVKSIGDNAFYWCENLATVTIGKGCESVGDYAFRYCGNIKTITLPSTLTYIGKYAFDTENILDVYDYSITPQDMSATNYSGYELSLLRGVLATARLHVPLQSVDLYKEAYYWCYFGTITPLETSEPEAIDQVFDGEDSSLHSNDVKILHNGQILIIRGDHTYTLTGAEVK